VWGVGPRGGAYDPTFELRHLTAKFHHPTFNRSEVIVLTNKLTNKHMQLKTSTSLRYAMPVGKYYAVVGAHLLLRIFFARLPLGTPYLHSELASQGHILKN